MDVKDALEKHDWLGEYWWNAVKADADEHTKEVDRDFSGGYFMRFLEGADMEFPLQSCLMMTEEGVQQKVHNIIIAEKGSNARIISGCVTDPQVGEGAHLGISEFYVKEGATLNFTMIHNWAETIKVRPRSAAVVEAGGTFISNYICLQPVADLQMYPKAFCRGRGSKATFNNIIYSSKNSKINAGSLVDLQGEGSSGEIVSRVIALDSAEITAPGKLIGSNTGVKAHMECQGLLLSDGAVIHAIPELRTSYKDVDMSHEAAVGKIADKEINYLMSRGLSREEATSTIVRGFLDTDILGLPKDLKLEIDKIVDSMVGGL
ncbi:MAG: SufD family Fe-S cluster assembly protein [Candidatus Altiarchaeales archaeon]|nr:SufD family Fe-S cluster assembly protein [Candidatus Altiarchaeales archaeon]MBD3416898.1 SufD family Fe-S cluster assembly protein [Candidatus Altiarchaeales archaeon]